MTHSWTQLTRPGRDIPDAVLPTSRTFPSFKHEDPQNIAPEGKLDTCITCMSRGEISFVRAGIVHVPENTKHLLCSVSCRPGDLWPWGPAGKVQLPIPYHSILHLPFKDISQVQARRQRHNGRKMFQSSFCILKCQI